MHRRLVIGPTVHRVIDVGLAARQGPVRHLMPALDGLRRGRGSGYIFRKRVTEHSGLNR